MIPLFNTKHGRRRLQKRVKSAVLWSQLSPSVATERFQDVLALKNKGSDTGEEE